MKKITVTIIVHNRFEYLEQALISIENQTYKNHEVIIIQNSPTTEVKKEIVSLKERYRFRTFVLDTDNISVARNFAINKSEGDYLTFLDDDVIFEECNFEERMNLAIKSEADLIISNYYFIDKAGKKINFITDLDRYSAMELKERINFKNVFSGINNGFFKLDSLRILPSFDENLVTCEDHDIFRSWNELGAKIEFLHSKISGYRLHSQGGTKNAFLMMSGELAHISKIMKGLSFETTDIVKYFERIGHDYELSNNYEDNLIFDKNKLMVQRINNVKTIDNILFINLDRSNDRRQSFEKQMLELDIVNYTRIPAVDAYSDDYFKLVSGKPSAALTPGEICCTLSHLKAIDYFVSHTSHERILICEDDLDLSSASYWNFNYSQILKNLPENWDAIQMSVTTDSGSEFVMGLQNREHNHYSAAAYLITRDYAIKILDLYKRDDKFDLSREFPYVERGCTSESVIYSDGVVYSLPIFLYKTSFNSLIHNDHIIDFHEPNRASQLYWWRSIYLKNEKHFSFFMPTECNVITVAVNFSSYSINLIEHNVLCKKDRIEKHAEKISKSFEVKIKSILMVLFRVKWLYNFFYKTYLLVRSFKIHLGNLRIKMTKA